MQLISFCKLNKRTKRKKVLRFTIYIVKNRLKDNLSLLITLLFIITSVKFYNSTKYFVKKIILHRIYR